MADLRYKVVVDDQEAKRKISELLKGSGVSASGMGDGSAEVKKSSTAVRQLTDEQKKLKAAQLENIESIRRLREERSKEISDLNVLKQLEQEAKTIAAERRAAAQNPIKDSSIENAKAITAAKIAEIESRKKNREAIDAEKIALSQSKNDNAIANAKAIKDAQLTTINTLRDARLELEKQKQAIQDLNTEYLQGKIDAQRYAQEQRKLSDAQRESARQAKETKRQLSQNSEYSKLTAELNRLRNESKNLLAEMVRLERQGYRNGAAYQQLESKSRTLVGQTKILDRQIKTIDTTVGQHYRNVGNYGDAISMVLPQISQFAGRLGLLGAVVAGVKKSFTSNLELEPLKQGINAVSSSSVQAEQTMDFLRKTSDRLGLQFSSTAESFKLWQGAAKFSNITASESKRIFESVATAGAKMKLSNDQVQGTFLALSQMMSKGKVQAEELRGQLAERLPGAFQLAAKAMGVTEQQLNKMLEKGEVVSKDFLPKFATELEKTFGSDKTERVEGMQASINRLSNEFEKLWQSDRAQRFFTTVTDGLADLTSTIGKLVKSDSWKEFFLRLGGSLSGGFGGQIMDIGATGLNSVSNKDDLQRKTFFESFAALTRKEQLEEIARQEKLIADREKYNKALVDPSLRANLEKMKSLVNPEVKPEKKLVDQKALDKAKKDAERAAERSRQAFERQRALQIEIDKINDNASKRNLTRDQQEILSIKEKYAKISEEVRKFNSDPKNKGLKVDTSGLPASEKREINDAIYKQQTSKILKSYQEDYQNFIKYEDLKKQYGTKVADEQLGQYKSTFEKIAGEYTGLQAKQSMVGLTGLEKERMEELEKMVIAHGKKVSEDRRAELLDALQSAESLNDKLLKIDKKYKDEYAALGKDITEEQKEELKKRRQEDIDSVNATESEKRTILLKGAKYWLAMTTSEIKKQVEIIKSLLASGNITGEFKDKLIIDLKKLEGALANGGKATALAALKEEAIKLNDELNLLIKNGTKSGDKFNELTEKLYENAEAQKSLKFNINQVFQVIQNYSREIQELGNAFQNLGDAFHSDTLSDIGGVLNGLASGLDNISVAFDESASESDRYAAAVQSLVRIISMVANASAERKRKEEEYYRSVTQMQNDYNIALNDQLRIQSQLGESIYLDDFAGRIKDGMKSAEEAISGYRLSVDKLLKDGKAVKGLNNAIDWKNVGGGVMSGVVMGAALGSIIPGIGNAIGAVVGGIIGGIVGLFGGKKKKESYKPVYEALPKEIRDALGSDDPKDLSKIKALLESMNKDGIVDKNTQQLINNTLEWIKQIEAAREQIRQAVSDLSGNLGNELRNSLVEAFEAGSNAAKAMGKTVNKVLEEMVSQLLFNRLFSDIFKDLEKELTDEILNSAINGDETGLIDVMDKFISKAGPAAEAFGKGLEALQKAGDAKGFDLFKGDGKSSGLSSSIQKELTEATASELTGLFRAQTDLLKRTFDETKNQGVTYGKHLQVAIDSLTALNSIQTNTANTVTELKNAVGELQSINKNLGGRY